MMLPRFFTQGLAVIFAMALSPVVVESAAISPRNAGPSSAAIVAVSAAGNGCPSGTVSAGFTLVKDAIDINFSSFNTAIGPGVATSQKSKNCLITLSLSYPNGNKYAVSEGLYYGFMNQLDSGVTAQWTSTYYFSTNAANTAVSQATQAGNSAWTNVNYAKSSLASSLVYPNCGASAILTVSVRFAMSATSSTASGSGSLDRHRINLNWLTC